MRLVVELYYELLALMRFRGQVDCCALALLPHSAVLARLVAIACFEGLGPHVPATVEAFDQGVLRRVATSLLLDI